MSDRRWARRLTIFYKIHNGLTPSYLSDHIPSRNVIDISLRNRNENPPLIRTERYENRFRIAFSVLPGIDLEQHAVFTIFDNVWPLLAKIASLMLQQFK